MEVFVRMRELISAHKELAGKINEFEEKVGEHDKDTTGIIRS